MLQAKDSRHNVMEQHALDDQAYEELMRASQVSLLS